MARSSLLFCIVAFAFLFGRENAAFSQEPKTSLRGKLVYFGRAATAGDKSFWIITQLRNGPEEKFVRIEDGAYSGRVSPQGDRVAFCSVTDGRGEVWMLSVDGRERSLLVETPTDSWIGGWSPDGKNLVYVHGDPENRSNFLIDVATKHVTPIRLPVSDAVWDWSHDGTEWLTVSSSSRETGRQIQRVRTDGSGLTCLTTPATDNISPRFSPDGKKVLFSSTRTKRSQLYVMDRGGKDVRQLTKYEDRSSSNGCWSPDGKEICCRSYKTGPVTDSGYAVFDPEVVLMNADGSDPKVFLPANGTIGWSIDWR